MAANFTILSKNTLPSLVVSEAHKEIMIAALRKPGREKRDGVKYAEAIAHFQLIKT